ncbi:aminotransferase class I/II-fold pyridoxal phosphate-dependent enzyme [Archangium gephyra]|nr:aminotransferase class I/II-fold pyridoxal phosphate-dependent enzyme [Archangium gephyra]
MLRTWKLTLEVDPSSPVPLFVQLARAVIRDIERGRLSPGDALPGTRALAVSLGIHRNTVEAFGYRPAWDALRLAGARLVGLPVDGQGMRVDALQALMAKRPVRAVYVTPHHQYPTTVTLTAARRMELLRLATEARVAVVEDDYDHEFHYEGRPVLPLASSDRAGCVVYVGSLSKLVAPGLRLGYVVAPAPLVRALSALRTVVDRQGDAPLERALVELLEEGELQRHARRARREYHARRDVLAEALHEELVGSVDFEVPAGGLALWARVDEALDVGAWAERAASHGVHVTPGHAFALEGHGPAAFRLGFASLTPQELREGVRRLALARPRRR